MTLALFDAIVSVALVQSFIKRIQIGFLELFRYSFVILSSLSVSELLEFLRTLKDFDLPAQFQKIRERLVFRVQTAAASASGNYIHMKPGKPIEYDSSTDNSSAEYVAPSNELQSERTPIVEPKRPPPISDSFLFSYRNEKQRISNSSTTSSFSAVSARPPTYLVVENPPSPTTEPVVVAASKITEIPKDEETQDSLVRTYEDMNSFEAEDKAVIFGQLKKKEKRFLFETLRAYWAGELISIFFFQNTSFIVNISETKFLVIFNTFLNVFRKQKVRLKNCAMKA